MRVPIAYPLVLALVALSGCLGAVADSLPPAPAAPFKLVAYGDSFTAVGVPGVGDIESLSWATGDDPAVNSLLQRVRQERPDAVGANAAISGARVRDLDRMWAKAGTGGDVVVVLLGINDYCWPGEPTPLGAFADDVDRGFRRIGSDHPRADVVVFGIPDLWRMHQAHRDQPGLVDRWRQFDYCSDTFGADDSPGAEILPQLRRESMNMLLRTHAIAHGFRYSDASAWPGWTLDDLSPIDRFHPGPSGEARLAEAAWPAVAPLL